jgi:hypothetical protein
MCPRTNHFKSLACAIVAFAILAVSVQAQQVPIPQSRRSGPAPGPMTKAYVQIARHELLKIRKEVLCPIGAHGFERHRPRQAFHWDPTRLYPSKRGQAPIHRAKKELPHSARPPAA